MRPPRRETRPDADLPDRVWMEAPGLSESETYPIAMQATEMARLFAPKLSGASARRFTPIWGPEWFGVAFPDTYVFYQERGVRPFTMRSLAGKTIPMWIDDPRGVVRRENPKAPTRIMYEGRVQVLLFRRAARMGQRKIVRRERGGETVEVDVPASFPGAPGRVARRVPPQSRRQFYPELPVHLRGGQIARGNVGVRWRHPGLRGGQFLARAMHIAAEVNAVPITPVQLGQGSLA